MEARPRWDRCRCVRNQIRAIVRVQVVDLHVQLRPAVQSSGRQVQIERVVPVARLADLRTIQLRLTFSGAFEDAPIVSGVQIPTTADGFLFETIAPDNFTKQMNFAWHCDAPANLSLSATDMPLDL